MLRPPRALLLDFGGVLVDAPPQPPAPPELVHRLARLVTGAVSDEQIATDLGAGSRAYALWRDDVGRSAEPVELPHARVWSDFVTRTWPQDARDAVEREATSLAYAWTWRAEWELRPGIPDALRAATAAGLPLAVVSNTLCGAAHRDFLTGVGLADLFAADLYSDEAGPRKPNPQLALLAADAVGTPIAECWFIGDTVHRDIACARRAGAQAAILMRSPRTDREPPHPDLTPDARVEDGHGLLALLRQVWDRADQPSAGA
ncbi:haloacid dehalogenase superfamily, subfamily IA, variant 1 with third motif having Dx(3-4)D or Dx(3-4)E [Micromonospora nigra]|uniref:Haloacid dehalogenase superfamily, subfamily IA, variant 1 with third motif having Dx(3-4)D or Dx(3-4)E n=1 Tax=Micromonospora nigra TaxID=145857 RepID=A0A1C6S0E0_9ACTN|nr:HAD family hydrolase [Micromonospora nigra]SCL22875.1 haloacid dehalogenase superfamily, subfamily IA, variant 1 with third motif having Dx(3-4)D or Dx(3-4)E [Micromonospora nigra]